jgi:hypothetical protein
LHERSNVHKTWEVLRATTQNLFETSTLEPDRNLIETSDVLSLVFPTESRETED